MKHLPLILGASCALSFLTYARADEWKSVDGPLKTRWAKDVSPGKALPEYPRPQMVRKDWLNLNGLSLPQPSWAMNPHPPLANQIPPGSSAPKTWGATS